MTKVETARNLALKVLEDVFVNQAYSNIALNKHLKGSQLSATDKGLVTELVYGTVARKLTLEWYLSHFIEDRDKLDNWIYVLLLMSVYQLQYLDKLPDHAVVNEAVELAKLLAVSTLVTKSFSYLQGTSNTVEEGSNVHLRFSCWLNLFE